MRDWNAMQREVEPRMKRGRRVLPTWLSLAFGVEEMEEMEERVGRKRLLRSIVSEARASGHGQHVDIDKAG